MQADWPGGEGSTNLRAREASRARRMTVHACGCVGALVLVWLAFRDVTWARVSALLIDRGPLLLVVLVPQLLALAVETWGWKLTLDELDHRVDYGRLFNVRTATEAVGQTLPAGVVFCETLKPVLLNHHCGMPFGAGVGAAAGRKFLRTAAHALYAGLAFAIGYRALREGSERVIGASGLEWILLGSALVLALVASGVALTLSQGSLAARLHCLLLRLPSARLRRALRNRRAHFGVADRETRRFFALGAPRLTPPTLLCVVAWSCEVFESWLILMLLGVPVGFDQLIGFDVAISLARQALFIVPAGLGVQDAGYRTLLEALAVPDAVNVAAAFALIKRGRELVWALIGFAVLGLIRRPAAAHLEGVRLPLGVAR